MPHGSRCVGVAEMRLGLFRRKQRAPRRQRRLRCVVAFNEQSGKAIFRETLIQANWPVT